MLLGKSVQIPPPFDSWSLSRSPLPPRSQLYSLEPIGIGTESVESLTGYTARLADAHSVSVGDLAGRVLSELSDSNGPVITAAARAWRVGGHGFHACSYAVNGVTDRAERWVHALEAATTRPDLRSLTLLPFCDILPGQMFRRHRAWCALCHDDWRASGQIVYEPLYWAIEVSSHCLVHARSLDCVCRHCARKLSPLGVFSRPGHCERCGNWLGMLADDGDRPSGEFATWSSTQVGGLLAMLPWVNPFTVRDSFRRSLNAYLEQITGGNVLALAQHIRCPRCILQNWLDGATVPRLENLLRTCRYLNIPASSLFDAAGPAPENIAAAKEALARAGSRDVSPSRHASEIRKALREALDEAVPRTLSEVARGLGYTKTERLYQADRTLCHKIAARYRRSGRSHWWRKPGAARICDAARLRQVLKQSLSSNMPTSVYELAATLGYANDGYVRRKYPELCREISEKIALAKRTRSDYVRSLLENALDEHPAPTLKDLSRRLGYSNSAVLRAHQPDLCDRLLARHRTHTLERRAALERMTLEALEETDVPSVRVLCKRLGITVWFMNEYFPAVRRMVAKRHRNCVAAETQRRHERLWRDVHHIAVELRNQGLYPSATRINERLPQGSCREWKALALAIRDAHKALRISK
jgi:AraC-like DNA-binding protein